MPRQVRIQPACSVVMGLRSGPECEVKDPLVSLVSLSCKAQGVGRPVGSTLVCWVRAGVVQGYSETAGMEASSEAGVRNCILCRPKPQGVQPPAGTARVRFTWIRMPPSSCAWPTETLEHGFEWSPSPPEAHAFPFWTSEPTAPSETNSQPPAERCEPWLESVPATESAGRGHD